MVTQSLCLDVVFRRFIVMPWAWTLLGNFTPDGNEEGVTNCSSPRRRCT